jgi:hypothetical protein
MPASEVAVRGPDGALVYVQQHDLAQAVAAGSEVATPEDVRKEQLQIEYGGMGGAAAAAGLGAVDSLTFGLGGGIATSAAEGFGGVEAKKRTQAALQGYEEANPGAYFGGQAAGMIAPALLSGGASIAAEGGMAARGLGAAGRIAGAIPEGVGMLSGLAERGVAGLVGEGAGSLMGRVAQKALPAAAQAAVEGAAWGAGHEYSDAVIKDHDLTAEKLMAAAGHDALWFGLLGGGLAGAGQLGKEAVSGMGNAIARKLEGTSFAEYLDKASGEQAYRAAGGTKKMTEATDTFFKGGHAEEGKIWRDQAPELVGKNSFAELTREELQQAASKGLERDGQRIGRVIDEVDVAAAEAGRLPRAADVRDDILTMVGRIKENAGSGAAARKMEEFGRDIERMTGMVDEAGVMVEHAGDITISVRKLRDIRRNADNVWNGSKTPASELFGYKKDFKQLRDMLEERVGGIVEEFGQGGLAKEYAESKRLYQAWSDLARATKSGTAAAGTNRFFSLTDNIWGAAAGHVGAGIGGPIGGLVGAGLGAVGNHLLRTRGSFVAASLLDKTARFAAVERMTARVDSQISEGVKGFFNTGVRAAGAANDNMPAPKKRADALRAAMAIQQQAGAPGIAHEHMTRAMGNLGPQFPNLTASMGARAGATVAYLAAHAPAIRSNVPSLTPQFDRKRVDEQKLHEFAERLDGVTDPMSAFEDMKRGKLSHAKADAIRQNYPQLFQQMQDKVYEYAAKLGEELPYDKSQQLSNLFGIPLNETQTPEFINAMQASKAADQAPPQEPPAAESQGGSRRPLKLDVSSLDPNPTRM